jgi:outer membrane immunogenic protein
MRRLNCALLATVAVVGFTSIASAADLPTKAPVYKAPAAAPVSNWTGFYVGLNAGYAWGNSDPFLISSVFTTVAPVSTLSPSGFIGGGQVGYNFQTESWVFGGELDFSGLNARAESSVSPFFSGKNSRISFSSRYDWLFTARMRAGVALAQSWLMYVTGGLAVTHVRDTVTCTDLAIGACEPGPVSTGGTWSSSQTLTGGVIGGGVEYAFSPNWSSKFEYLFAKFSDTTPTSTVTGAFPLFSFHHDLNIVRFGINYKFRG